MKSRPKSFHCTVLNLEKITEKGRKVHLEKCNVSCSIRRPLLWYSRMRHATVLARALGIGYVCQRTRHCYK